MKNVISTFVCLFLLLSCQKKETQTNKSEAIIKEFFNHFNKHEFDKMAAMYVENAEFKDPTFGKGIVRQARIQTVKKYQELQSIFPDIHDEIQTIYSSDENQIIVEFISSGTALDKTKFELPICTIFTLENGLITKDFTYFDNSQDTK